MTRRIPRPHPAMLSLARDLADIKRRLREMETASQAGFTSVEGRTLDFYDPVTDELLGSIGLQPDGTFGFSRTGGAKPQAPTEPDVQPIPGGAIVAWDGRFEDAQSMLQIDRIAVHMDETAGFTVTRDTEVAAIYSHTGGTAVIPIDDGTEWYVKLVAVSKGQVWSDPSTEVYVAAVAADVAFYQDEFTLTVDGAQNLPLSFEPIAFSEHLYWNGLYQREDVAWTREGTTVSLTGAPYPAKAGDHVLVEYAYLEPGDLIPFGADGWSYKIIGRTDDTDYSATSYDDTAWPVGACAFGSDTGTDEYAPYGGYKTNWPLDGRIWLRRTFAGVTSATVRVRLDNYCDVYWNGTLLQSFSHVVGNKEDYDNPYMVDVPAELLSDTKNVLAVRATDDAPVAEDKALIDVEVTGTWAAQ